jgi:hypothetical protein
LPLLDALLTDDKFVARLKQDVKLSDEQIESIKRVSSAAITRLRESNAEELDGTNGDPRQRAEQELGFKRHSADVTWSKRGANGHARGC